MKDKIYFVGAGGIGMAALVRYFLSKGMAVAGYDRTPSDLTTRLRQEGAQIIFDDDPELIPLPFRDPADTLVVFTPAIPDDNRILSHFRQGGFEVVKRSELLGKITRDTSGICVAGSHGKTTTCSMIAHLLNGSDVGCNAFLGGILRNVDSNLVLSDHSPWSVIEADEYDRSFHRLRPQIAVVTSCDPDHLDIYGDEKHYLEAFSVFTSLIKPDGVLITHTGLKYVPAPPEGTRVYTYSGKGDHADFMALNVRAEQGRLLFDFRSPLGDYDGLELGVPIEINVDNAVAAVAAAQLAGVPEKDIREGLRTFLGAKRRFEFWLRPEGEGTILLDDYAHSPGEIEASIRSMRRLYPDRRISVVFQPHLYTRTRDFAPEFAEALSHADEVVLLEIYPAREEPIPGVTSKIIFDRLTCPDKSLIERKNLLSWLKNRNFEILMTLGAADIERLLPQIKSLLTDNG